MSTTMRAKMKVSRVERWDGADKVTMNAVCRTGGYPADGIDENNSYAKFTPQGELTLTIANPALVGMIEPGATYYLDFTPAD